MISSLFCFYLLQIHDTLRNHAVEALVTVGTDPLGLFVSVHDALEYGGHGGDPNPRANQDGVFRLKDLPGGRAVRTVNVTL